MISNNIDKMIMEAMKSHDETRTNTLRLIKAKFIEYKTSKGAKPIDDNIEITLLKKMVTQREESAAIYDNAGRAEQAKKERDEIAIISEFLPAPVDEGMIRAEFKNVVDGGIVCEKKNMGIIIKNIKAKYPQADGKLVASIVGEMINK